jgi:GntR family transcriptional regulator/MocR family aminotransferase
VIYVGSFSKTLFPGLRVAYLVAPQELVGAFRQALRQTGQEPSLPVQAALHDFIEQGLFSRHVRRMRAIYAARNRALTDALVTHLHPFGEPLPADGGLQLTFMLRDGLDDDAIAKAAKAAGFGVEALSRYRAVQDRPGGLVFGVGTTGREPIEASVLRLKRHIRAVC